MEKGIRVVKLENRKYQIFCRLITGIWTIINIQSSTHEHRGTEWPPVPPFEHAKRAPFISRRNTRIYACSAPGISVKYFINSARVYRRRFSSDKNISMAISRAYCLHFAPLSFLIVPRFFKPSISIGGPLSSFLKNLPPSLSAFSFVIMRFRDDEIEAFFTIKRESYMKVCSLSVSLSVMIDSRILISWSLRNLFSHDVCRNE